MKFIDEIVVRVEAGKGGNGCASFRREKYIPFGGPDGGDGGDGGSIYFEGNPNINTLVELRFKSKLSAPSGKPGMGRQRTGQSGEDLILPVPLGTICYDNDTDELIGEITQSNERLCVAQGGKHGLGNIRFKSSVNRAPRQFTHGTPGEQRTLRLELRVMADVGLLGYPNAGKSTLIRAVSAASPKVAGYPFTTLKPHLGVVTPDSERQFVMADIPGLIEGASEGVGLGIQFLKHLSRCRLLLHIVDIAEGDTDTVVNAILAISKELNQYSKELAQKERWLVFNKTDLLPPGDLSKRTKAIIDALHWKDPVYHLSAIKKQGTQALCYDLAEKLG